MNDRRFQILSLLSALVLVLLYGISAGHFRWFPAGWVLPALDQVRWLVVGEGDHNQHPVRYDLQGVQAYGSRGAYQPEPQPGDAPGVTLITTLWPDNGWTPGIRVVDRSGEVLHEWLLDIPALWPKSPYDDPFADERNIPDNYVHGCHLFPNGDILFSIEFLGLMRMNAKGEVLWKLDRRTHHALHPTEDGNFWVCAANWLGEEEVLRRFPLLGQEAWEDVVLLVSPDGEVLKEVSVLEVVYNSLHRALIWHAQAAGPSFSLLHTNDVESLPAALAGQYPLFEAGDLMVSMREIHLVCVFDPNTAKMKWAAPRIFTMQHDPDFIGDGWVSVYDNNPDGSMDGAVRGGSRLLAIQAHSERIKQIYPNPGSPSRHERRFFSHLGGKAQLLPNGGWMFCEPTAGRVFEVDASKSTVWEWGHQHKGDKLFEVLEGTRYPFTPDQVRAWTAD